MEDEMVGWHHRLNGHESEWTPRVGDGQGGLALRFMGSQRVGHDWATELKHTECFLIFSLVVLSAWNAHSCLIKRQTHTFHFRSHLSSPPDQKCLPDHCFSSSLLSFLSILTVSVSFFPLSGIRMGLGYLLNSLGWFSKVQVHWGLGIYLFPSCASKSPVWCLANLLIDLINSNGHMLLLASFSVDTRPRRSRTCKLHTTHFSTVRSHDITDN